MITDKRLRKVVLGLAAPLALALSCGGGDAKPDGGGLGGSGQGGVTGGGGSTGLPACSAVQRTPSFTDCSEFDLTGDWVTADRAVAGDDGGIYLPGGELVLPMGGTIANGDYDLVKSTAGSGLRTRRTMRVFDNAAYIAFVVDNDQSAADAGVLHYRVNINATVANTVIQVDQSNCGSLSNYSYTVSGQQLLLFNFDAPALSTYQQRCAR